MEKRALLILLIAATALVVIRPSQAPALELEWADVVETLPDPTVVNDPAVREAIVATGLPWRVRDSASGIELLLVPPGAYLRGAAADDPYDRANERPRHRVEISRPFYLGRYEVSNAEFRRWAPEHDSGDWERDPTVSLNDDDHPVVEVTWQQARAFARHFGLRLPTEAEWEYVARAGVETRYPWGNDITAGGGWGNVFNEDVKQRIPAMDWEAFAWSDGWVATSPRGRFHPNAWGFYDMFGNVWEVVEDSFDDQLYASLPGTVVDPLYDAGGRRTLRGGGFGNAPRGSGIPYRYGMPADQGHFGNGFRVARWPDGMRTRRHSESRAAVIELCLEGELDLGRRYQGLTPAAGEWYPVTWCVVTEDASERVLFRSRGLANPDYDDSWSVAYLPPDRVRIVQRESPPDVEFAGTSDPAEARRLRRIDPLRLAEELSAAENGIEGLAVQLEAGRVRRVTTSAALPLRGPTEVVWEWEWDDPERPRLRILLGGEPLFRAAGSYRALADAEAAALWEPSGGLEPVAVPGENWPARVDMRLEELTDDVWLVRGVRTGFQHLVVGTGQGLVVADAPAGWVEMHQIPPTDLVPGLGVSGLSERLVDFLAAELPGSKLRAVALTHFHDDHAGGARAFAAVGAEVYAPASSADFLEGALNRETIEGDRLAAAGGRVEVVPVTEPVALAGERAEVRLLPLGPGPHVEASLAVWAVERDVLFVSDVHVPRSDDPAPPPERAGTECWFARWAVGALPASVRVINSHSAVETPVSRLAEVLESDVCGDRDQSPSSGR